MTVYIFAPGSTNINSVRPSFEIPTETISDWLNVALVRSRRSSEMCFFEVERATYRRLFCGFDGAETVNNFSSVKKMKLTSNSKKRCNSCLARTNHAS